jgi:hypothetical protein
MERTRTHSTVNGTLFFLKKGFPDFGTHFVPFQYGMVQNAFHDFGNVYFLKKKAFIFLERVLGDYHLHPHSIKEYSKRSK